jgi:DNA-directed RNA polymerase sigma subunit (sigma70/sigma32)
VSRPTTTELLLAETRQYAILTPAQEFATATRAAAGSRKARHLLVLHNMRFAHYIALQYRFTMLPHDDVLSAVCAGMLTAAERFDPTRGVREHRARRGRQR